MIWVWFLLFKGKQSIIGAVQCLTSTGTFCLRNLEWEKVYLEAATGKQHRWLEGQIFPYKTVCVCVCVCVPALNSFSCVLLFVTLWTSPLGFSVHGILQARILEWVAMAASRGSSWLKNRAVLQAGSSSTEPPGKPTYKADRSYFPE